MADKDYKAFIVEGEVREPQIIDNISKIFFSHRNNIFQVVMIVRHAEDGKMYLYDMMDIKKETSNLFQS